MDPIVLTIISAIAIILGPTIGALISRRKRKPRRRNPRLIVLGESPPLVSFRRSKTRRELTPMPVIVLPNLLFLDRGETSHREHPMVGAVTDRQPGIDLISELRTIRKDLLAASSDCELQACRLKIEGFLSRHSGYPEGLLLRSQIIQAIQLSRKLKIFTYLQLLMFMFVLFVEIVGRLRRSRLTTTFDNPVTTKRNCAHATQSEPRCATWDGRFDQALALASS